MINSMKTETTLKRFSFERAAILLRNRLLDDAPAIAVAAGAIIALNLLAIVFDNAPFLNKNFGPSTGWPAIVAIGGVLLAAKAFDRMHDGRSGPEWLLLPASSAEKYLSAATTYLVVYPIIASILATGLSAGLALVGELARTGGGTIWNPLATISLESTLAYFTFILFALAGTARFRKLALGKTAAIAAGWTLVMGAIFMFGIALVMPELRPFILNMDAEMGPARGPGLNFNLNAAISPEKGDALHVLAEVMRWISVVFAAGYGFTLVSEKEARDEVQ
jgi:hypothetical protein